MAIAYALAKLVATLTPVPTALPLIAVAIALAGFGRRGIGLGCLSGVAGRELDPIAAMKSD